VLCGDESITIWSVDKRPHRVIAKGEALKQSRQGGNLPHPDPLPEGESLTLTLSRRERENDNEIAEQEFILG